MNECKNVVTVHYLLHKMATNTQKSIKDPLLLSTKVPPGRKTANHFSSLETSIQGNIKISIIILLWQFSVTLSFNLLLIQATYILNGDNKGIIEFTIILAVLFLFSPVAGMWLM